MNRPSYIIGDYTKSKFFNNESRLVCGTSGLGGVWGTQAEEDSINIILYALERGVRVFDTAPSYSNAQEYLGKALKRWSGPKPFISTKLGRLRSEVADEEIVDYRPEVMRKSVYESLELIGTDKIDLLFLHEPHRVHEEKMDEIMDTLKGFLKEGIADRLGVGGNPPPWFYKYMTKDNFSVLSGWIKLNACNLNAMEDDIPHIKKEGIAYYNASVLHLALLGTRLERYDTERPDSAWISNRDVDIALRASEIAKNHGMTLSSMAFRYALSMQETDRMVIGSRKMEQMAEALDSWERGPLDKEVFEEITDNVLFHRAD